MSRLSHRPHILGTAALIFFVPYWGELAATSSDQEVLVKSAWIKMKSSTGDGQTKHWRSFYTDLKTIDHHVFVEAEDLKVKTKQMPVLYEGSVKSLHRLRELRMSTCGITKIMPRAFKNLPLLSGLHLERNLLTEVREGVFNYLSVRQLYLHRNKIEFVEGGAFDHMPNLETIKLNGNKLRQWDPQWFKDTPSLTNIYFRRNKITELPARAFANIKGSHKVHGDYLYDTNIFLSRNQIAYVHPAAFRGLDGLNQLWLDRNEISELHRDTFAHMAEMNALHLRKNHLNALHPQLLAKLAEIDELDLSRNRFQCLPFDIVARAKLVYLGDNPVDCACVRNLQDKLVGEGREGKITVEDCTY